MWVAYQKYWLKCLRSRKVFGECRNRGRENHPRNFAQTGANNYIPTVGYIKSYGCMKLNCEAAIKSSLFSSAKLSFKLKLIFSKYTVLQLSWWDSPVLKANFGLEMRKSITWVIVV